MEHLGELIDFHFALALIAIFGVAGSLYLQFSLTNLEFDMLNSSIYYVGHGHEADTRENTSLNRQLDQLEKEFEALDVQDTQPLQ